MQKQLLIKLSSNKSFTRLLGKDKPGINLRSGLVILGPGKTVGEHSTENKEEVLIILSGTARVDIGKKSYLAKRGSFLYIPPRVHHNVRNNSRSKLKYVYITTSA